MRIRFIDHSGCLSDAHRDHAHRSIRYNFSRFGQEIGQITIYMQDSIGPRSEAGKQCRMRAELRRGSEVDVVQQGGSFGECVQLASRRLRRAVRRHLDLRGQFNRRTVRRLQPSTGN